MAKAKITSDARGFDAESAGKLLDRIYACEPLLTGEVVDMIEERMQSDFGVARRIGLASASKGGDWFRSIASMNRADAIVIASSSIVIHEHVERMKELVDWLTTAEMRVRVALCARDDYTAITAEAARATT